MVAKASRSRVFAAEGVLPKDALSTPYTLKAYNQNQTKGELGGLATRRQLAVRVVGSLQRRLFKPPLVRCAILCPWSFLYGSVWNLQGFLGGQGGPP